MRKQISSEEMSAGLVPLPTIIWEQHPWPQSPCKRNLLKRPATVSSNSIEVVLAKSTINANISQPYENIKYDENT